MSEKPKLNVLVVEDCEDDFELELLALEQSGFDVSASRVESAAELRRALESQSWEVVICDYSLPSLDGPSALKLVRSMRQDLPLIIVSGAIDEVQAVEALRGGRRIMSSKATWPGSGRLCSGSCGKRRVGSGRSLRRRTCGRPRTAFESRR